MLKRNKWFLIVAFALVTFLTLPAIRVWAASDWYENWDSYATGQSMHGVNGWKGWDNLSGNTANTSSSRFICAPNSIEIKENTDLVHEFSGYNDGVWRFSAWQYVPADFFGQTYFILMNQYTDGGPYNWSTQVSFNGSGNVVVAEFDPYETLPLKKGQWVELRVDIDLENNLQRFYYGGTQLYEAPWLRDMNSIANIAAIDLYANGATAVFYDNLSLTEPSDSVIGWANLQWPPSLTQQAGTPSDNVYGQVWIDGLTQNPGAAAGLRAELGYGPQGSDPSGIDWKWTEAEFNTDAANNDEFKATLTINSPDTYDYCFRYSFKGGLPVYADLNGPTGAGSSLPNPGILTVTPSSSDTEPPSITAPADITEEATGPDGAVVTFAATATDDVGPVTITYSKDPGTIFPLGITSVTCTATDGAGKTADAVFDVNVVDTTPPELNIPADLTVNATCSGGEVVNFNVTATDIVSLEGLDVTPASGTLFPIGSTIVNCTATDNAGNSASASFTVKVLAIEVTIDVKPGDDLNNIILKGKGVLPVAVLGSADLDVSQINPDSVVFAGASPSNWSEPEDVNLDQIPDLVFQFKTQKTNLAVGITQATLGGLTSEGFYFTGSNMVQIIK
jgi:hypothetical protein